jgi:iron complex transport system substrate-binding protein
MVGEGAEGIGRRRLLGLGAAGAAAFTLAVVGCGGDDDDDTETGGGNDDGANTNSNDATGPRTVEHRYGETEVPADPQRVVTIGLIDHDAVLACGVVPVAVTSNEYSADQPFGVWPWAADELGDAEPEVLDDVELNFEKIASLEPDLILAIYSGITQDDYDLLAAIAPTVGPSADHDDYTTPWTEMTQVIGQALGREDEAEAAIQAVEDQFAEQREAHPEFEGQTAVYAGYLEAGKYYAEKEGSTRAAILKELGFEIAEIDGGDPLYVEVSSEQADLFDHDLVLWELGDQTMADDIEGDAIYETLDVAKEGRDVFVVDPAVAGGLALISVLSLPFVIDALVPQLAAAVDGDPTTVVPS